MSQYRFVGTHTEIFDTAFSFKRFGQLVEIPDALAQDAIAHGAALLPVAKFDSLGFTADELKRYWNPATHKNAPVDFTAKRNAAWTKLHEVTSEPTKAEAVADAPNHTAAKAETEKK